MSKSKEETQQEEIQHHWVTSRGQKYNNRDKTEFDNILTQIKNNTVTSLDLKKDVDGPYGRIGDEGAKCIAEALKSNDSITSMDLSDNNIGIIGIRALSNEIIHHRSLTNLTFDNAKQTKPGPLYECDNWEGNKLWNIERHKLLEIVHINAEHPSANDEQVLDLLGESYTNYSGDESCVIA